MKHEGAIDTKLIGFTAVAAILGATFAIAMSANAATTDTTNAPGRGPGGCTSEQHDAVEAALEAGDYTTWKDLVGDRGHMSDVITADNFATFVAMHQAMEDGDTTKAQTLRDDLGLGTQAQDGTGFRGRMHGGMGGGRGGR
jgi:hypothetical protein